LPVNPAEHPEKIYREKASVRLGFVAARSSATGREA
jgi:hypothetical protein